MLDSACPRSGVRSRLVVGVSGALTGWASLEDLTQLWTTLYGQLLLAKVAALVVLGGIGHRHRCRTVAAVLDGRPRGFLVLATVELLLMAGTAGLAVGLSRTAPPEAAVHSTAMVQSLSPR